MINLNNAEIYVLFFIIINNMEYTLIVSHNLVEYAEIFIKFFRNITIDYDDNIDSIKKEFYKYNNNLWLLVDNNNHIYGITNSLIYLCSTGNVSNKLNKFFGNMYRSYYAYERNLQSSILEMCFLGENLLYGKKLKGSASLFENILKKNNFLCGNQFFICDIIWFMCIKGNDTNSDIINDWNKRVNDYIKI